MSGSAGALVCACIGGVIGFAQGDNAAEKAEGAKWGAIFGIFIGVVLGFAVVSTV